MKASDVFTNLNNGVDINIIYHSPCPDGVTSAAIASNYLKNHGRRAKFHPTSYGSKPPSIPDNSIVMFLDFAWNKVDLMDLIERSRMVIVLDHHKSHQQELFGIDHPKANIVFDMDKSGCGLTWEFFYPALQYPEMVKYVQDRDLWRFSHDETKPFASYLQSINSSIDEYSKLLIKMESRNGHYDVMMMADACYKLECSLVKRACKSAVMVRFVYNDGIYIVPAVNTGVYQSEVGHELLQLHPEARFSATFYRSSHSDWRWGLRGRGDFDVSEVAKMFGGGGHHNAAGFEVKAVDNYKHATPAGIYTTPLDLTW